MNEKNYQYRFNNLRSVWPMPWHTFSCLQYNLRRKKEERCSNFKPMQTFQISVQIIVPDNRRHKGCVTTAFRQGTVHTLQPLQHCSCCLCLLQKISEQKIIKINKCFRWRWCLSKNHPTLKINVRKYIANLTVQRFFFKSLVLIENLGFNRNHSLFKISMC